MIFYYPAMYSTANNNQAVSTAISVDLVARKQSNRINKDTPMKMLMLLTLSTTLTLGMVEAQSADAAAGEQRYTENCVNCHGKEGKGMASFPSLVGRDVDYIAERLMTYRAGENVGPNSAIMFSWAKDLSDDDIANLAAYVSTTFQ